MSTVSHKLQSNLYLIKLPLLENGGGGGGGPFEKVCGLQVMQVSSQWFTDSFVHKETLRGRSRGRVQGECNPPPLPPPGMTCGFLIKLVFCIFVFAFKICLLHQSVTPFLSGAPAPKKNPGSAPESDIKTLNSWRVWLLNRGLTV